jgi:phosphoribosylaminoimidazole-succinocarboxamide synthase
MAKEVWLSKQALTKGIKRIETTEDVRATTTSVVDASLPLGNQWYNITNFHITEQSAREQAEKMRQAAIRSLEKKLTKLRSLKF